MNVRTVSVTRALYEYDSNNRPVTNAKNEKLRAGFQVDGCTVTGVDGGSKSGTVRDEDKDRIWHLVYVYTPFRKLEPRSHTSHIKA